MRIRSLVLVLSVISILRAQIFINPQEHIFSNTLTISAYYGLNSVSGDYEKGNGINSSFGFPVSYYFGIGKKTALGVEAGYFSGSFRYASEPVKTNMQSFRVGVSLSKEMSLSLVPYIGVGIGYASIEPETAGFEAGKGGIFNTDAGIHSQITENLFATAAIGVNFPAHDLIDGMKAGSNNDYFTSIKLGITYRLFGDNDTDSDGIPDKIDSCPDEPEDYDGFRDDDGCPDNDNDKDGIADENDNCPDEEEDYDGFADSDGCPDFDNDRDGIPDVNDKCPNRAEDYDGFEDDDGCPESDNDGDGVNDENDGCPYDAEDFDGFEDADGCPDYDNDGDNIIDADDKCPCEKEDINGIEDEDGCPDAIPDTLVTDINRKDSIKVDNEESLRKKEMPSRYVFDAGIYFVAGKYEIEKSSVSGINAAIRQMKDDPASLWIIEGHTDKNTFSTDRKAGGKYAAALFKYLVSRGIKPERLIIKDEGKSKPLSSNTTAYGRMRNNRVELIRKN